MLKKKSKPVSVISFILAVAFFFSFIKTGDALKQNDASVNLIVKLDNIEAGTVTVSQLAGVNLVAAMIINATDGTPINYTVNGFTFTAVPAKGAKDSTTYSEATKGDALTRTMKAKIVHLQPGSTVIIKNISATSPQNMNVSYGSTNWQVVADPTVPGR